MLGHRYRNLAPGLGELGARHFRRVNYLAVVAIIVVHIKDDLDAVLLCVIQGLLDAAQFSCVQFGTQLGLDTLPEEAQANQLEAEPGVTLVVGLVRVGIALVVDTRNSTWIEHTRTEVDTHKINTAAITDYRGRSRCWSRGWCRGRRRSRRNGRRRRSGAGAAGYNTDGLGIADSAGGQGGAFEHDREMSAYVIDRSDRPYLAIGQLDR